MNSAADLCFGLAPYLTTRELARVIEVHAAIGSTNDRAKELARAGAARGTAVVADAQTKGRGQRGRAWSSPPGVGLYVSFVVRPKLPPRRAPTLTLLAGVAVRDAVEQVSGVRAMIKWPNDLLAREAPVYGRKLAGVLVEVSADPLRIDHGVIGVGLNVLAGARAPELAGYATSLEELLRVAGLVPEPDDEALDRAVLLAAIAGQLERRLDEAEQVGFRTIIEDWTEHAAGKGQPASLDVDGETITGVLEGVAEDGALLVTTPRGERAFHRGDLNLPGVPPKPPAKS